MTCKSVNASSTLKEKKKEIQRGVFHEGESAEAEASSCPKEAVMGRGELGGDSAESGCCFIRSQVGQGGENRAGGERGLEAFSFVLKMRETHI